MRYTYKVEIDKKGTQRWYKPGTEELHNEHGPAIVYADGTKKWYLNGTQLTEEEWNARTSSCEGKKNND